MTKTKRLIDSKFIKLIQLLNKEEIKSFQKFLKSPYFNKKEHLAKLFDLLSNAHPKFDSPRFNKTTILKKMFSDTAPTFENKLAKQMTELVQLFDEFLKHQIVKEDQTVSHSLLAKALAQKANFELFASKAKAYQDILNEHPVRDSKFYLAQFSVSRDLYLQSLQTSFDGEKNYLLQSKKHLDRFYYLTKLVLICGLFARNKLLKDQSDLSSMNETIQHVKNHYADDSPVFSIYIQLIELYQYEIDDELYESIVDCFRNHIDLFSVEQQSNILYQLTNYAAGRIKANQKQFHLTLIKLYQLGLKKNIFLNGAYLPEQTFLNIAVCFSIAKRFDLVEQMIDYELEKLPPDSQDSAKILILAFSEFHKGNFSKALILVKSCTANSLPYLLRIRLLTIRCLYELRLTNHSYEDTLISYIRSYESFFKRANTFKSEIAEDYLNFSEALRAILFRNPLWPLDKTKATLNQKITTYDSIVARSWLFDKVSLLK